MKTLVFGAGGQVAQELLALAASRRLDVRGLSRAEADITDAKAVDRALKENSPAVVVNGAGYTAVDRAEQELDAAMAANADGPGVLAEACAARGVPLIHLSTDYVFDGKKQGAYTEKDAIAPLGAYGRSKAEGEKRVRDAGGEHVILRTSWVYGAYGQNFLKSMLKLARERDELKIVGDQFGCPTSTEDIAEAILAAIRALSEKKKAGGLYHFAGSGRASWFDFAGEIVKQQAPYTGRTPKVSRITTAEYPTAAERPANSELDSSRFRATFGYAAKPWQTRTAETVKRLLAPAESRKAVS